MVPMTEEQIRVGTKILAEHVGRLANAAQTLIATDPGLAYSLWSIGVEEAAKLAALREAAARRANAVPSWALGRNGDVPKGVSVHEHKFETGLRAIGVSQNSVISKSVKVRANASDKVRTIRNTAPDGVPLNIAISVGPFTTGEFEDTSNTDLESGMLSVSRVSHALRFQNLYVDFDAGDGWSNPVVEISGQGVVGSVSLSTHGMGVLVARLAAFAVRL